MEDLREPELHYVRAQTGGMCQDLDMSERLVQTNAPENQMNIHLINICERIQIYIAHFLSFNF